jgi:CCR4-NOT transcription complex subunit 4
MHEKKSSIRNLLKNSTNMKMKLDLLVSKNEKLANLRIIQKQLIYVIGLPFSLINKEVIINLIIQEKLKRFEYFGQYGLITKLVINKKKMYNASNKSAPSFSAYVTYSKPEEAALALLSLDNSYVEGHLIRVSFGTTKYCQNFLKNVNCPNKNCQFIHFLASPCNVVDKVRLKFNF